jgi:GR25 family glycosyltransferase involved in LPS biosynthesis
MTSARFIGRYINLDRSPERRLEIERQLSQLGLAERYTRFAAVDGQAITDRPDVANRAEVGCYRSHLDAIRLGAPPQSWLHIAEDDVVLSRHLPQVFDRLMTQEAFQDFDIVFTNVMVLFGVAPIAEWRMLFDRAVTMTPDGAVTGVKSFSAVALDHIPFYLCTSYAIHPHAIGKVTDLLAEAFARQPFEPVDIVLGRLANTGALKAACTMPFFSAPQLLGASTIRQEMVRTRGAHMFMEWAFFADRDPARLRAQLGALAAEKAQSPTADLIADAYRYLLNLL